MKKRFIAMVYAIAIGISSIAAPAFAMENDTINTEDTVDLLSENLNQTDDTGQAEDTDQIGDTDQTEDTNQIEDTDQTEDTDRTEDTNQIEDTDQTEDIVESESEIESDSEEETEEKIKNQDMHRLYNPNSGEHFYTSNVNEKNHLTNVGWNYEGISWKAPEKGDPVYRLYNPNAGDHHYTMNANERDHLVNVGWNYEGIGWYSDTQKAVPIFRVYNPNAVAGSHHYSANYAEIQHLVSVGWRYEGIGWYSCEGTVTSIGGSESSTVIGEERVEVSNIQSDKGLFDVTVYIQRDANQVKKVYVPVWVSQDQSDIKWYETKKQSDGSYKVTVDAANHNWTSGKYKVHSYILTPQGDTRYIAETTVDMKPKARLDVVKLDGSSVRIRVYGLPSNVTKVRFPTWSVEKDQDDLVWYEGTKKSDGSWSIDVHSWNHKSIGSYICDVYVTVNGTESCTDRVEFTISERATNKWIWLDGYKRYLNSEGVLDTDVSRLVTGPYFIKVYKNSNYLIVYAQDENGAYKVPVKAMVTSCGHATPVGTFYTPYKWRWLTMLGGSKAQWVTQITGDFLFHSVPYRIADPTALYVDNMYNHLGTTRSAGCIRLQAGNAKWIYDNCELRTKVTITTSESGGPLAKPEFTPVPSWHTWDPTDPTVRHLCEQHGCH